MISFVRLYFQQSVPASLISNLVECVLPQIDGVLGRTFYSSIGSSNGLATSEEPTESEGPVAMTAAEKTANDATAKEYMVDDLFTKTTM